MSELTTIIARLSKLIDEETAAMRSGNHAALADFNFRKGHAFLELSRAISGNAKEQARDPAVAEMFVDLRAKLEVNQKVLKLHLDAVNEVTSVLSKVIRDSESDGTYSQGIWRQGYEQW